MPAWAQTLLQLVVAALDWWRKRKAQHRVDVVRADPADEWLRKFGGEDKRIAASAKDAGGDSDG